MSYQNGTTHYNLPQTVGTDKRDWSDTNKAFADIDAAIYNAVEGSTTANESIAQTNSNLDSTNENVEQNTSDITALETRMSAAEGNISDNDTSIDNLEASLNTTNNNLSTAVTNVEDMITAYNESSATATHDYTAGDYFIYNNVLYKATVAISSGSTIVPNTNCSATNVSTELRREDMYSVDLPVQNNETWAEYFARYATTIINLCENSGRAPLCCLEQPPTETDPYEGGIFHCYRMDESMAVFGNLTNSNSGGMYTILNVISPTLTCQRKLNEFTLSGAVSGSDLSSTPATPMRLYY